MHFINLPNRPKVPGAQIAYKKFTANHPKKKLKFICMPGGPGGDHSIFASHTDFLTQFGDVILFDPRGCGLSHANGAEDYQIETYIDDIEALRQHFQIESNFILLGISYGSMAAQGYAVKYPQNLAGFGENGFLKTFDWRPHLHQINCPTLIIGGQENWVNTPDQWEIMHQKIRNSELQIIPGASHMVFVDQEDAYFKTLANFLEKV